MAGTRKRTAVLISGRGSNMQALVAAAVAPAYPADVVAVIANDPAAKGLEWARQTGLDARVVDHRAFKRDREAFDAALDAMLQDLGIEIVALAGFMRLLTPGFVDAWLGRMINIHPSLLPAFKGLETHARTLDAGVRIAGCTVHYVVAEMDAGPIIAQAAVPVLDGDDENRLATRILQAEHMIYPLALGLVASGRCRLEAGRAVFDRFDDAGENQAAILISPHMKSID